MTWIHEPASFTQCHSAENILPPRTGRPGIWIVLVLLTITIGIPGCGPAVEPVAPTLTEAIPATETAEPTETIVVSPSPMATVAPPTPTVRPMATQTPQATPIRIVAKPNPVLPTPLALVRPAAPRHVSTSAQATKISQLIGDYDKDKQKPTLSLTESRYNLVATDLGVPFRHKDRTYVLFGDSNGARGGDAIGYTTDTNPEDGLRLDFVHDASGVYKPITIPGISQGDFEVPVEGVSIGDRMYVYHTTDHTNGPQGDKMGRSVLAVSDDDGQSFRYLYDVSRQYFINVSIVQADTAAWPGLPQSAGPGLVMFGSGSYRQSNVYLAFQPADQINTRASLRYWTGLDGQGQPLWGTKEDAAKPLFNQPCVGEFSVSYNRFIRKWIMLYNCDMPNLRGINMRTADQPWGPWSEPQLIFRPWEDNGYCHFMHTNWSFRKCDNVQGPNGDNIWGGEYGPYQFEDMAVGNDSATTIYFTMSTWNPYNVVLMKASLKLEPN